MDFRALASDFDGTLALNGRVDAVTIKAVQRLIDSGRYFIMVTGRELPDLQRVFPQWRMCAKIVAENGAILFDPATGKKELLGQPPPEEFIATLRRHGVYDLGRGEVILGTYGSHLQEVQAAITESGLPLGITMNKETLMILPADVDKASGLRHALAELNLSPEDTIAIGDAENDHAFLDICRCAVAVSNATPELKKGAHIITKGACGAGVTELIEQLLANELPAFAEVRV